MYSRYTNERLRGSSEETHSEPHSCMADNLLAQLQTEKVEIPKHIVSLLQMWYNSSSLVIASDAVFYSLRMKCD